jgi:hypothetical protein
MNEFEVLGNKNVYRVPAKSGSLGTALRSVVLLEPV